MPPHQAQKVPGAQHLNTMRLEAHEGTPPVQAPQETRPLSCRSRAGFSSRMTLGALRTHVTRGASAMKPFPAPPALGDRRTGISTLSGTAEAHVTGHPAPASKQDPLQVARAHPGLWSPLRCPPPLLGKESTWLPSLRKTTQVTGKYPFWGLLVGGVFFNQIVGQSHGDWSRRVLRLGMGGGRVARGLRGRRVSDKPF